TKCFWAYNTSMSILCTSIITKSSCIFSSCMISLCSHGFQMFFNILMLPGFKMFFNILQLHSFRIFFSVLLLRDVLIVMVFTCRTTSRLRHHDSNAICGHGELKHDLGFFEMGIFLD
ncbi:hypothetical protein VIGAN_02035500, partial [Vigna angularis var. angularis]